MPFSNLLKDTLTVSRLAITTGAKRVYTSPGSVSAMIQPLTAEQTQYQGLALGSGFKAFCDFEADIKAGDKAIDQDSREFRVQGIKKHTYGSRPHTEVILILQGD
jgi:hypothetical protein